MGPTQTFVLQYQDLDIIVVSQWEKGVEIFRLEWPDNSMDFIYVDDEDGKSVWRSKTIMDEKDLAKLGKLIEKKISE